MESCLGFRGGGWILRRYKCGTYKYSDYLIPCQNLWVRYGEAGRSRPGCRGVPSLAQVLGGGFGSCWSEDITGHDYRTLELRVGKRGSGRHGRRWLWVGRSRSAQEKAFPDVPHAVEDGLVADREFR